MDGWNGHICSNPSANHHCIGPHSYPGNEIEENRNLAWEISVAGKACSSLDRTPPCISSVNAFGSDTLAAAIEPPKFFASASRTTWRLPPATVCVWPFEEMYRDEAKTSGRFDHAKRFELAKSYFACIEAGKILAVSNTHRGT